MTIRFTKDHEWISVDGDIGTVGITDYAQEQLGDITYVDLPSVGAALSAGADMGAVESVKAASGVYMPLDGEVVAVNDLLENSPELVNEDPLGEGWFFRFIPADMNQVAALLDQVGLPAEAAYRYWGGAASRSGHLKPISRRRRTRRS